MDIELDPCRSRPALTEPSAPRAAPLRLPDIRPPPSPSEQSMRLICQMQDAAEEARERRRRDSSNGSGLGAGRLSDRTRSRPRPAGGGLEDFLNDAPRRPGRAGRQSRASRPTQRQAIDDETTVPAEVFDAMLRLGQEARSRATHTMAFAQPDGRPYLRHHDASALLAAAREEEPAPTAAAAPLADPASASSIAVEEPEATAPPAVPILPPRPPSSCASEVASGHSAWDAHVEAMAMQVS